MHSEKRNSLRKRKKRAQRVRQTLRGNEQKPRLSVFKSNRHLYAQLIDDVTGKTIVGLGTMSKEVADKKSKSAAKTLGTMIAEKATKAKVTMCVFDRGRYKYHGLIAELADAAREAGLKF